MIKASRLWFMLLFFLATFLVRAQEKDAGLWISLDLEKKISPAFSVLFTEEIRLNDNITEVGSILTDLGVKYRFSKRFKVGATYRFAKKRLLDNTYQNGHGFYIDLYYTEKLKPIQVTARLRYQSKYTESDFYEGISVGSDHTRMKLEGMYDLPGSFKPYLSIEAFFNFTHPVYFPLDEMRYCAGVEYKINRMHSIDLHYMIARECNVKHPETDFVIGVGYRVRF